MNIIKVLLLAIMLLSICACNANESTDDTLPNWKIIGRISAGYGDVYEVALSADIAYIADSFDGLHVIDLHDPTNPEEIGMIDPYAPYSWAADNFYNVQVKENIAYIMVNPGCPGWCTGSWEELRIYDISQPSSIVLLGSIKIAATDIFVDGDYVYATNVNLTTSEPLLSIIDISDPHNPLIKSSVEINSAGCLAKHDDIVFISLSGLSNFEGLLGVDVSDTLNPEVLSPQGWYASSVPAIPFVVYQDTGYIALGIGGVQVLDLSDPADIYSIGTISTTSSSNNIEVSGKYMYVSTDDGVEVFDISEPEDPIFVTEIPTDTSAVLTRIDGCLGIVITAKVIEQNDYGSSIIEDEKLLVFKVPQK